MHLRTWILFTVSCFLFAFSKTQAADFTYVANSGASNINVIDNATDTIIATITTGAEPRDIAILSNQLFAYVPNDTPGDAVNVIDIRIGQNITVATIPLAALSAPAAVAITPDDAFVYTANAAGTVNVIDTMTNTVVATVTIAGSALRDVAITPNGAFAYFTDSTGSDVFVIDTATNTVVDTIPVGTGPNFIAITPDGAFAYATNAGTSNVSVIDTSTNMVVATIAVGAIPNGVAITPDGATAYAVNFGTLNISVIDTSTNMVVATIPLALPGAPVNPSVTPEGDFLYVPKNTGDHVNIIDTATNMVVATIPVAGGSVPQAVAFASPPNSVLSIRAKTSKNNFLTQTDLFNRITWVDPEDEITTYEFYKNGVLIAVLPRFTTEFIDHNQKNGETNTYRVVAFAGDFEIASGTVTLTAFR